MRQGTLSDGADVLREVFREAKNRHSKKEWLQTKTRWRSRSSIVTQSMTDDIPIDLNASTGPSFTQGIIDALWAAKERAWGIGDGKVYHKEKIGSEQEAAHAKGQEYACIRMMAEGNTALDLIGKSN